MLKQQLYVIMGSLDNNDNKNIMKLYFGRWIWNFI